MTYIHMYVSIEKYETYFLIFFPVVTSESIGLGDASVLLSCVNFSNANSIDSK